MIPSISCGMDVLSMISRLGLPALVNYLLKVGALHSIANIDE